MRSIYNKQTQKNRATRFIIISLLALAVIAAGVFWFMDTNKPVNNSVTNSDTAGNNGPSKQDVANTTVPSESTSQDVPIQENLGVQITKLEQANGTVTIAGTVTGSTGGMCVAEFTTPEDRPVTKEMPATVADGKTACGPTSIDEIQFSYLGDWKVVLKYYTADNKGQASSEQKVIQIH